MRIFSLIVVCISAFFAPLWFAVCAGVLYNIFWEGYELIFLGIIIDSLFGHTHLDALPLYTFLYTFSVISLALIKPYFILYNTHS